MTQPVLMIDGDVAYPVAFSPDELSDFEPGDRVDDVSQLDARRRGEAATLAGLLRRAVPNASATHLTLHSSDGYSASVPLEETRDRGLILFQIDGQPVAIEAGGPFRFLIPNSAECKTAELDACANVKGLARIELTAGKGRDSR